MLNHRTGRTGRHTTSRDQDKCSRCRSKKQKCLPRDRDWETNRQKCSSCLTSGSDCSQNYFCKDDPGVNRSNVRGLARLAERSQESVQEAATPDSSQSSEHGDFGRNLGAHYPPGKGDRSEDSQVSICALSHKDLRGEALSKLETFGTWTLIKSHNSRDLMCLEHQKYHKTWWYRQVQNASTFAAFRLHELFISITELGFEAHRRNLDDLAHLVFLKLLYAMQMCLDLCDGRKKQIMQEIALFFQRIGDQIEFERTMELADGINNDPGPFETPDTKVLLSWSYGKTSDAASKVLSTHWQKFCGAPYVPLDCYFSPLQRAQHRQDLGMADEILKQSSHDPPSSNMLRQQDIHIAAALGWLPRLDECIRAGADINARDLMERSPLFTAAIFGHSDCCRRLLQSNADLRSRDLINRTILEVAAEFGHSDVISVLLEANADINPQLMDTNSSPLQAAICSDFLNPDLVIFLVRKGADVYMRRVLDNKNAIDLAKERQLDDLVQLMQTSNNSARGFHGGYGFNA